MPVYNGERWIGAAIDSLLTQTYSNLELVISDNASSDGTERICRHYAERDARVRLSEGAEFSAGTDVDTGAFVRLNFATSPAVLDEILGRLAPAIANPAPGRAGT